MGMKMYENIEKYIDKLMTSAPDMPLWNIESIKQGKKPAWNYIDGCMTTSLLEMYKTTGDKKYLDFVISFVSYYVHEDGSILGYEPTKYSTDDVCESRILFDLYHITGKEKYLKAIDLTFSQVKNHPRTKEGNFIHKAIYHDQIWLDGLFMMQPFYTRYQSEFGKKDYSDIVKQFSNVRAIMYDEKAGLYYHGYDFNSGINNYKSVFTEEQIKLIRSCREEKNMRNYEIYKLFPSVSHTAIDQVLNYKTYKKIPC